MPLTFILRTNALSCLAFGMLFIATPEGVSRFLSVNPVQPWLFQALGALLLVNGVLLLATSFQSRPKRELILFFSAGDFAWVLGTLVLVVANTVITTVPGMVSALTVAVFVGGLGAAQFRAIDLTST